MFYRKIVVQKSFSKCFLNSVNHLTNNTYWRQNASSSRQFSEEFDIKTNEKELQSIQDVELNLFGNGNRMHNPVINSRELLQKYRIDADLKSVQKSFSSRKRIDKKIPKTEVEWTKNPDKLSKHRTPSLPVIVNDTDLGFKYTKLNHNDKILHQLFTNIKSKKRNDKSKRIIIEGRRIILEALNSGFNLETLIFSQKDQLLLIKDDIQKLDKTEVFKTPHHDLKTWSTLVTCPGLIGIFQHPSKQYKAVKKQKDILPITVICDNIREPNNLGSIIRVCSAIPCYQVIVLKGCCDPWETKAIRGGCGGQFRINIEDDICWDHIQEILPKEFSVYLAENNLLKLEGFGTSVNKYSDINLSNDHNVIVIGGETHGISEHGYRLLQEKTGKIVHIPLAEGVESLNTASALAIILFELRRSHIDGLIKEEK